MTRPRLVVVVTAVAVTMLAGLAPAVATERASPPTAPDGTPDSPDIPERYRNQPVDWHPCAAGELPESLPKGAENLDCATYLVPADWRRPDDGQDVTIAASRLRATGEARDSVFTNPGGPGAPGRSFPAHLRNRGKLRQNQEVIGFDPRGTGKSTNISCGGAVEVTKPLDPRDRTEPNLNLILDATQYAASSCQAKSGELGPLINTEQTVRDIDLLRTLLGRDRINWVGYSAGTWLGAHYASRFPRHTGRFVLDSNTEFTATWQQSFDGQPLAFERRWRQDFLPWLAGYDRLYHFGETGEAARQTYEQVRAALAGKPVEVDGKIVGPNEFDTVIGSSMYDKGAFPGLADYLVNVRTLTGNAPEEQKSLAAALVGARSGVPVYGPRPLRVRTDGDGSEDAYDASFWTIPCNEGPWTGNRKSVVDQSDRLLRDGLPLLGAGWLIQPCIFWRTRPSALPRLDGRGVPPVLMVQSTHDPATPIEGATRAHRAFQGSRMLTVTGEGDHGIYAGGNSCVDGVVENYLVDGVVPEDSSCPGRPLPVPPGG